MLFLAILAGLIIAFSIGSNNSSNALGICIGAGVIPFKKGIIIFGVFVFAGIFFSGAKVMHTVGKSLTQLNPELVSLSLLLSALIILLSNWKHLPLSTHQVIIGSLTGCAFAKGYFVNVKYLFYILISWITAPIVAGILSMILYEFISKSFKKLPFFSTEVLVRIFLLLSATLISYNTGANELATVLGPIMTPKIYSYHYIIFLLASVSLFLGAVTLSSRVLDTIGKGIVPLDPISGFVAQLSAGVCLLGFTHIGMPVSTTHSLIGAISGIGFSKGFHTIKTKMLKKIGLNWIFTTIAAFLISFFIAKFF